MTGIHLGRPLAAHFRLKINSAPKKQNSRIDYDMVHRVAEAPPS